MRRLFQTMLLGPLLSKAGGQKLGNMLARVNQKDLAFISELLADGRVVPVIDRCYPLSETAVALRYVEAGHAKGKVVIQLA
jgi:NADPH:quinone reductase-like Zn-dependent oxidoreductase